MGIAESALSFVRVVPEAPGGRSPGALLILALILSRRSVQGLSPSWVINLTARCVTRRCHRSGRNSSADGNSERPQWDCDDDGCNCQIRKTFRHGVPRQTGRFANVFQGMGWCLLDLKFHKRRLAIHGDVHRILSGGKLLAVERLVERGLARALKQDHDRRCPFLRVPFVVCR